MRRALLHWAAVVCLCAVWLWVPSPAAADDPKSLPIGEPTPANTVIPHDSSLQSGNVERIPPAAIPSSSNTVTPAGDSLEDPKTAFVPELAPSGTPTDYQETVDNDGATDSAQSTTAISTDQPGWKEPAEQLAVDASLPPARQVTLSRLLRPNAVEAADLPPFPGTTSSVASDGVLETPEHSSEQAASPPAPASSEAATEPSNHSESRNNSTEPPALVTDTQSEADSVNSSLPDDSDDTTSQGGTAEDSTQPGDAGTPAQGLAGLIGRILGTGTALGENGEALGDVPEAGEGEGTNTNDDHQGNAVEDVSPSPISTTASSPEIGEEASVEVMADGSVAVVDDTDATVVVDDIEIVQDDVAGLGDAADDAGIAVHAKVNFAKAGAGAVVIRANEESQNKASLLSESRDSYFMSPCAANKFIDVQLSDDVTVTDIVLSNFERFASVIEDFRLLGSQSYPSNHWIVLGNFTAEDRHGEQMFQVSPTSKMTMVRYLRIRWLSHHRSEYYCTLTGIKVHGHNAIQSLEKEMNRRNANGHPEDDDDDEAAAALVAAGEDEDGIANEPEAVAEVVESAPLEAQHTATSIEPEELVTSSDDIEASPDPITEVETRAETNESEPIQSVVAEVLEQGEGGTDSEAAAQEHSKTSPEPGNASLQTLDEPAVSKTEPVDVGESPPKTLLSIKPVDTTPETDTGGSNDDDHEVDEVQSALPSSDLPDGITKADHINNTVDSAPSQTNTLDNSTSAKQQETSSPPIDSEPAMHHVHNPANASAAINATDPVVSESESDPSIKALEQHPPLSLSDPQATITTPLSTSNVLQNQEQEQQQEETTVPEPAASSQSDSRDIEAPDSGDIEASDTLLQSVQARRSSQLLGGMRTVRPDQLPLPAEVIDTPSCQEAPLLPKDAVTEVIAPIRASPAPSTAHGRVCTQHQLGSKAVALLVEPTCMLRSPWYAKESGKQPTSPLHAPSLVNCTMTATANTTAAQGVVATGAPSPQPSSSASVSSQPDVAEPSPEPEIATMVVTATAAAVQVTPPAAVTMSSPPPGMPVASTAVPVASTAVPVASTAVPVASTAVPNITAVPDVFNLTKRPQKQVQVGQNTWQVLLDHIEDISKARGKDAKRLYNFVRVLQQQANIVVQRLGAATATALQASNLSAVAQVQLQQRINDVAASVNASLKQISEAGVSMAWTSSLCEPETMEQLHKWAPAAFVMAIMLVFTVLWQCCMTCALRSQVLSLSRKVEQLQRSSLPKARIRPPIVVQAGLTASGSTDVPAATHIFD